MRKNVDKSKLLIAFFKTQKCIRINFKRLPSD